MAAFGQAPAAALNPPPATSNPPSSKRPLPNGPCNHRDQAVGTCGCNQFWDKGSEDIHDASTESRDGSERSTWCVCGHHACFHQLEYRARDRLPTPISNRAISSAGNDTRARTPSAIRALRTVEEDGTTAGPLRRSQLGRSRIPTTGTIQRSTSQRPQNDKPEKPGQAFQDSISQPSTSYQPRIPSVCLLDSTEQAAFATRMEGYTGGNRNQTGRSPQGLGLLMNMSGVGLADNRRGSFSTVPEDALHAAHGQRNGSQAPSISDFNAQQAHSGSTNLELLVDFNRQVPQININPHDTMPDTFNPDDFIQSATEVATPSVHNTPDLASVDRNVQDAKKLVELLARNAEKHAVVGDTRPNTATHSSRGGPQLLVNNSPANFQDPLQNAFRSASPHTLQNIYPYLGPLHNLLSSIPNIPMAFRELNDRMDGFEANSFAHVNPEDVNQQFQLVDDRLLHLESRMEDHEKMHEAIDADRSSRDQMPLNRRGPTASESLQSFQSASVAHSMTSVSLAAAAIDRKEIEVKLEGIEDRLGTLEAAALPTSVAPWTIEVVLLPWGKDLRGIWYSPDEAMHDSTQVRTQDTEEWTQARSVRSMSRSSLPLNEANSGWSSQAISQWADETDDWLFPKACGRNNLAYQRLQSRGFVRNVSITSANAGDIQHAIGKAFVSLLEHLGSADDTDDGQRLDNGERSVTSYPGLKASFIPLRKVFKSSRLRFLSLAEMATPALWTAQFLVSGITMRLSKAVRRLYVTQREAYLQESSAPQTCWTWQRLRELRRVRPIPKTPRDGSNSQSHHSNSSTSHVAEADAKESYWSFHIGLDQPSTATSSFNSAHSGQLSLRPADPYHWLTEGPVEEDAAIHSAAKIKAPLSPLSNFTRRPSIGPRRRTYSAPLTDDDAFATAPTQPPHNTSASTSKRRLGASFDPSTARRSHSRHASMSISNPKRLRLARSPSPLPTQRSQHSSHAIRAGWANTPRRSKEPPSPFFSSPGPQRLPRSNSDATSRSQRSVAAGQRTVSGGSAGAKSGNGNTPFAYATPHSGMVAGGGFDGYPGYGFGEEGGDTEVDSASDNDGDPDADANGSWHGPSSQEHNQERSWRPPRRVDIHVEDEDGDEEMGVTGGSGSEDELNLDPDTGAGAQMVVEISDDEGEREGGSFSDGDGSDSGFADEDEYEQEDEEDDDE